jgi:hypothetical protein
MNIQKACIAYCEVAPKQLADFVYKPDDLNNL